MNTRKMVVETNGPFEFFDRFRQKSRLPVGASKDDAKLWPIAELRKHAIVDLLCCIELTLLEVNQPKCVRDVIVIGFEFQRRSEFLSGLAKLSKHEIALPHHVVRASILRVAKPSFIERHESLVELLRVEIGNR